MQGTIVCGVTDSAEGRAALELGVALAGRLGLRLVLVHVRPDGEDGETAGSLGPELARGAELRVVRGPRVDALARVAAEEGADAIVLGSRARGARGRQLRCTLARELEAATAVPVLIAPPATRRRSARRLTAAPPVAAH